MTGDGDIVNDASHTAAASAPYRTDRTTRDDGGATVNDENQTSRAGSSLISRRNVLRAGVVGAAGVGILGAAATRGSRAVAAGGTGFTPTKSDEVHLVATDGWVSMPAGQGGPRVLAGRAGSGPVQHVRLRVPRRHRATANGNPDDGHHRAARSGADLGAGARLRRGQRGQDHADQPRPVDAPRPRRRPHAALARLQQRHPDLRRRARDVGVGPDRQVDHLLLPPARGRHVHVPLPLRGRRARADGHDRPALRAAEAERRGPRQRHPGRHLRLQRPGDEVRP